MRVDYEKHTFMATTANVLWVPPEHMSTIREGFSANSERIVREELDGLDCRPSASAMSDDALGRVPEQTSGRHVVGLKLPRVFTKRPADQTDQIPRKRGF